MIATTRSIGLFLIIIVATLWYDATTVRAQLEYANTKPYKVWFQGGGGTGRGGYVDSSGHWHPCIIRWGKVWDSTSDYIDFSQENRELGINCESRGYFVDFPENPSDVPIDTVLGGPARPQLNMIIASSNLGSVAYSPILRFELERHSAEGSKSSQYPGFLSRSGLTGVNGHITSATTPQYLRYNSERSGDTAFNSLMLRRGVSPPGVFADTMWNPGWQNGASEVYYFNKYEYFNRKLLFRFRSRLDEAIGPMDSDKVVFTFHLVQYGDTLGRPKHQDTTFAITARSYKYATLQFDTIGIRLLSAPHPTYGFLTLEWPANLSATFDYMEVLTGRLDTMQEAAEKVFPWSWQREDFIKPENYRYLNAEQMLADSAALLKHYVSFFLKNYGNSVGYLGLDEEFPLGVNTIAKRLSKILYDSTQGRIELLDITHDSAEVFPAIWKYGQPHIPTDLFEGVRLGYEDSALYRDLKFFMVENYPWSTGTCCDNTRLSYPKRILTSNLNTLRAWETQYIHAFSADGNDGRIPYDREEFLQFSQSHLKGYISSYDQARRLIDRNPDMRFGSAWQMGAAVTTVTLQDRRSVDTAARIINNIGLLFCTSPMIKVTGHIATSMGASGFSLYAFYNADNYGNGGLMDRNGYHGSNFYTFEKVWEHDGKRDTLRTPFWTGFKERYDSVAHLIPLLKTYGDTLQQKCKFLASYVANNVDTAATYLPFIATSIRAQDTNGNTDRWSANDSLNRTYVHISVWIDTTMSTPDTLLYITNLRVDDSYDSTGNAKLDKQGVPGKFDRRTVTLQLKGDHRVVDVADTQRRQSRKGRVLTPIVQSGGRAAVDLLAGDGVLIRLARTK